MNKVTHHIRFAPHEDARLSVMSASVLTPIYSRWGKFSVSVFSQPDYYGQVTRVSCGFRAATKTDGAQNRYASLDGIVHLPLNGRRIEQQISLPILHGDILQFSYLGGAGEDAGRFVSNAILRQYEAIAKIIRQHILKFSPSNRDIVLALDKSHGQVTTTAITKLLSKINWKFLLSQTGCDERTSDVIDFTLCNNAPQFAGLLGDDSGIQPFNRHGCHYTNHELDRRLNEERGRMEATRWLNSKNGDVAADMLLEVLGQKHYDSFAKEGVVNVSQDGYYFELRPGRFVTCTDPNGGTAELCIHTAGLSCHPIDEVVLAALNIKHHFREFMRTSIYHGVNNFTKPFGIAA